MSDAHAVPQRRAAAADDTATLELIDRHVSRIIEARRARDKLLGGDLFADPGWDILLRLYRAGMADQQVTTSLVFRQAAVPVTTAIR